MTLNGEVAVVFPSIGAAASALTALANPARVGEHLTERPG